tara:strand:- start:2129 stop:2635 length:507 start_codon:yes stop_codon:yes gene_type:complete
MHFNLKQIEIKELKLVLDMFKDAAIQISKKNIDHWQYWKNPPPEKVKWVKDGLKLKQFFFIVSDNKKIMGMVRVLNKDLLYWGDNEDRACYIHSLTIKEKFNGLGLGAAVLNEIEKEAINCDYLRLDCDSKNPQLCSYYVNLGFRKVGEKKLPLSVYNLYEKQININL